MNPAQFPISAFARSLRIAAFAAVGCLGTSFGQMTLVATSPFAPSGSSAAAGSQEPQDFELTGSSSSGSNVTVCIYERHAKRSQWIPVGGDVDGVRVISFDSAHDQVVVMISGQRKEISMRKATVASSNSYVQPRQAPVMSAPAAPVAPIAAASAPTTGVTTAPEQEQREARMLVSDLLEIGVQQRKAYQEAKLKAAAGTPAAPGN